MKNNNVIPIFFASDENYAPYLCTTIYSILENTKSFVEIYVLDGGILEESKILIQQSLLKFANFSIEYIDMSRFDLNRFPNLRHYSINTFSRYFIPELKPNLNKVLYLDVDIIAKDDIAKLYFQDLEGYPIGAVLEDFYGLNGKYIQEYIDPNFKSGIKSFNAGILILDIQQFIKNNYSKILVDKTIELADRLSAPDQDVLNIVFENNYKIIDYRWNFMIDLFDKFKKMYPQKAKEIIKDYSIVHYVSHKPWKNELSLAQKDFMDIANKTMFSKKINETLQRNIKDEIEPKKLSTIQKIFSITNSNGRKHKIITILGIKIKIKRK